MNNEPTPSAVTIWIAVFNMEGYIVSAHEQSEIALDMYIAQQKGMELLVKTSFTIPLIEQKPHVYHSPLLS